MRSAPHDRTTPRRPSGSGARPSFGAAVAFWGYGFLRTIVYIDGFNLYYGALKGKPYKWVNVDSLVSAMLKPHHQITRIRYFTAKVDPRPNDLDQPIRQLAYLRALSTIPHLDIHYGNFQTKPSKLPTKASVDAGRPVFVEVMRPEEKGSDVNLASYLLRDGFKKECDCAIVISNDSDLLTPISMARRECGLTVGALLPRQGGSHELKAAVNFWRHIRPAFLQNSVFPDSMQDAQGPFHKPARW